ncbi:MAG: hypothetical protein V4636_02345 [Pseudomonadota bacterium]
MLDLDALRNLRPFVATPSHGGTMHSAYVRSLLGLVNAAWTHGFPMQTRFLDGDSLIPRARNRLVAEFMADDRWTHLFFIDADIGFEPEAALRLLLAGRDVVAGAYPLKTDGWPEAGLAAPLPAGSTRADFEARHANFPINLLPGTSRLGAAEQIDADGFLPVAHAPAGFMLIARGAFERLARAMPELRYSPEGVAGGAAEIDWPHHRFFDVLAEPGNGRYLSEDFAFCERWRGIGGEVFVDTQSALVHHGARAYGGHLGRALAIGRG